MVRDDQGGVRKRMGDRGREAEETWRTGSGSGSNAAIPDTQTAGEHRMIRERRKVHVRAITGGRGRPITGWVQADQCEAIFPY